MTTTPAPIPSGSQRRGGSSPTGGAATDPAGIGPSISAVDPGGGGHDPVGRGNDEGVVGGRPPGWLDDSPRVGVGQDGGGDWPWRCDPGGPAIGGRSMVLFGASSPETAMSARQEDARSDARA
jgi:hypothetical protein